MSHYDEAPEETEDRFYAQFDSREVKLMTLDELQSAFEAGEIHENTFVCREGEGEWLTLAIVAGMGEEQEEEPAPEPVAERRPPMPNRAPAAVETRPPMPNRTPDTGSVRPPMPNRAPDTGSVRPPMPNRAPDTGSVRPPLPNRALDTSSVRPPLPNRRPELMDTVPPSRQVAAYPSVAPARAVAAPATPLSFGPVTSNIDYSSLDLDELSLRPKRRVGRVLGAVVVLGLLGGGAAFAATGGLHHFVLPSMAALESAAGKSQASLTLSNIETKPTPPAPVAAPVTPTPAPVAADPAPAPVPSSPTSGAPTTPATPAAASGFSDDMKQALLAADNDRKTKHAQKIKGRTPSASASAPRHGHAGGSATGFKSGGSAYDPLNGKL